MYQGIITTFIHYLKFISKRILVKIHVSQSANELAGKINALNAIQWI